MELQFNRRRQHARAALIFMALAAPMGLYAQTDEIHVYGAEIADQGIFNLMIHTNFTPNGRKTPDLPGGIIPNHSVNGAAEWAYGLTDWFEQGLYMPVWTPYSEGRGGSLDGFKIRELFLRPHARDHTFFYGINFEFSVDYHYWESRRFTSEVRPIVGLHLHRMEFIYNPIVDTNYTGGFGNLESSQRGGLPTTSATTRPSLSKNMPTSGRYAALFPGTTSFMRYGRWWITISRA